VFTSHERDLAKSAWNSTSARLSRDSFLPFASCRLCLLPAREPVSCSHGDIFCRECALSNILAQKKDIKRMEKIKEKEDKEADEEADRAEEEAKQRAVQEFEKIQMGLEAKVGDSKKIIGREDGKILVEEEVAGKRGEKRKFELDEDELLRIARDERMKARKAIDDEKVCVTAIYWWIPSKHLLGFQNDSSLILGSFNYTHIKHKVNITYDIKESQTVASVPRVSTGQTPFLLAPRPRIGRI
jgi:nitric oxide synthase-interacting protein